MFTRKAAALNPEGDEVREVIGVEVREQDVANRVPVDSGLHDIGQRPRPEVQEQKLISLNDIAGCRAPGMDIGTGAEDGQAHGQTSFDF